jgi:pre-mRNA-splicing helicase BRR2
MANAGHHVHRLVHNFPKLQHVSYYALSVNHLTSLLRLQAQVQPITRSFIRIDLSITADFR